MMESTTLEYSENKAKYNHINHI